MDICTNIDIPRYIPKEKRALYPEEIAAIRKADFTDRERCFVYLIYDCGLRCAEALALNKDLHVNLKRGVLKVSNAIYYVGLDGHEMDM
ncbi:MAG: hypothetical protein LUC94_03900 [Clostridiales bacterium]|nr:hypothetical protein [Clostridiales bacterium]